MWYNCPCEVNSMNLIDAKTLLERRRIPYRTVQYENETEYWHHLMPFPRMTNGRKGKVTALVIPAPNGEKDIELQFNRIRGGFALENLWFGGYGFEMSDIDPDLLEADLLDIIGQIVDGKMTVILCNDLKRKRWVSDGCFDLKDNDNVFGAPGYREALARIEAPKTFLGKILGRKLQYDIYDWRTHRQIIK